MEPIVDECWTLVDLAYGLVLMAFLFRLDGGAVLLLFALAGALILYGLTYRFAPVLLRRTMPESLRASLPDDRFLAHKSPAAPKTYRELFARWLVRGHATR
jgi:hypothetical protein